jgi:hypothetical protein
MNLVELLNLTFERELAAAGTQMSNSLYYVGIVRKRKQRNPTSPLWKAAEGRSASSVRT